jgi:hypothetical protein
MFFQVLIPSWWSPKPVSFSQEFRHTRFGFVSAHFIVEAAQQEKEILDGDLSKIDKIINFIENPDKRKLIEKIS